MGTKVVLTTGDVLARVGAALDAADHEFGLMTDAALLGSAAGALVLADRTHAFALSLLADCTRNGLLPTGTELSPGELRRLACDADLLPAVLGGPSGVLDVGRDHRLVTPTIRAALTARDKGCVFPGCDRPPAACDAHHLQPWQHGGTTSLTNLVLACRHHHGIIEPGERPEHIRWRVRLRDDGVPEVIPPLHVDPQRRPRIHQRFRVPDRAG